MSHATFLCPEEKETQEKEVKKKKHDLLSEQKWQWIFTRLQPFLRPYGDSKDGRLDFYHRALSKAVRKRLERKCLYLCGMIMSSVHFHLFSPQSNTLH